VSTDGDELRTHVLGHAPAIEVAAADLVVTEGPDLGQRTRLVPGTSRIGTAPGCRLVLVDPTVSRLHCEIRLGPGGARIVDLGSTNGTFVDAVRVYDAELRPGATIRLGSSSLCVETGAQRQVLPVSTRDGLGDLIGASLEMRTIYSIIERVAATDSTVLVQGETGTGKELVARAIHEASARAQGPFVAVDCGAIAENLMESELFGHARGAFTGAVTERRGLFEEAHGGSLFLDEVGELPLALQPKLLRALEAREVRRVGANTGRRIDVRVVAATHRSLAESVNQGAFREDLYYRLAVVEIVVPSLRSRREDIPRLARHFWKSFSGPSAPFPEQLVPDLLARSWPGNVRELRNFVERTVALGWATGRATDAGPAAPAGLDPLVPLHLPLQEARRVWNDQFEALYAGAMLRHTDGNVTRAAELAGVNRRSLQRMIAKLGLRARDED
jgi:DNA-binding NtrC family response regulator